MSEKSIVDRIIEGLQILKKYSNGWDVGAEHDIFYGPGQPQDVSLEDAAALEALGWFVEYETESYAIFV